MGYGVGVEGLLEFASMRACGFGVRGVVRSIVMHVFHFNIESEITNLAE